MKIMDNVKFFLTLITVGIALFILLNLKTCGCKTKIQEVRDSLIQTNHIVDTIYAKDTIYIFKKIKIKVLDSLANKTKDSTNLNVLRVYNDSLNDSNITINYKDTVLGKLISKDLSYKLKVPIKILDTTIITKTYTNTITKTEYKPSRFSLSTGFSGITNKQTIGLEPFIKADIKTIGLQYGYDFINKNHRISISKQLFKIN